MTGGLYDLEFALAALAALFILAGSMVWVTPKSADYLSELLARRARALTAAREAYKSVWSQTPWSYLIFNREYIKDMDETIPSVEHRGGCMGHS